jgi:NAD(P)H-dependent flavin oxidoreductase YrpB (nitropropane dioxygenase family)
VVSFTFGCPDVAVVRELHRSGCQVLITVTTQAEAVAAEAAGADQLVVQSAEAGAHSATANPAQLPEMLPIAQLLQQIRAVSGLPLVAAGGISTAIQVRDALAAGAAAALVGTALLRTEESGASQIHKDALADPARTSTVVTRAFTGRPARALRNRFTDRYSAIAPVGYPEIHHLTRPLRAAAAAAGDPELVHLWAGTGFRHARTGPAAAVIDELARAL